MTYFTFHIDDSGAIEDIDYKKVNGQTIPVCKMYDDNDFNKLNDILHSLDDYILNEKALNIFKESKVRFNKSCCNQKRKNTRHFKKE